MWNTIFSLFWFLLILFTLSKLLFQQPQSIFTGNSATGPQTKTEKLFHFETSSLLHLNRTLFGVLVQRLHYHIKHKLDKNIRTNNNGHFGSAVQADPKWPPIQFLVYSHSVRLTIYKDYFVDFMLFYVVWKY